MNGLKDAYSILGEEKMELAHELALKMKGKTTSQSLDVILEYMPKITEGKRFSDEERRVVINSIREGMTDTEKMRLDEILAVIGMV